jgi:hypothetical protein
MNASGNGRRRAYFAGSKNCICGFWFSRGFWFCEGPDAFDFAKGRTLLVLWEDRRAGRFCFAETQMLLVLWEDRKAGGFCFAEGPKAFGFVMGRTLLVLRFCTSMYIAQCSLDSSALSSSGFTVPPVSMPSVMVTWLFPHTYDFSCHPQWLL